MKYLTGEDVLVGDKVIADDSDGIVVCVIDNGQFTDDYPKGWAYLEKGLLVETTALGLIHYLKTDEDLILTARKS